MADNVNITQGTGTIIAADDIAGVLHQRVKLSQGADGAAVDVSSAAPLNVTLANTGANATPIVVDLGANNDVTVASLPLPTGAATSALQTQPGVDIGDVTINNAAGASAVNIQDGGNSITVDGTVAVSGTVTVASHAVTNAGTFAVQNTAATPAGTNNIGDVDVLTINGVAPAFGTGVRGATVQRVTIATDDSVPVTIATNTPVGNVAHDAADSGSPLKTGGRARTSDITSVANDDRTDSVHTKNGFQVVFPFCLPENLVNGAITTAMTGTTSTSLIAAPGAGLYNYITQVTVSNSHATVGTDVTLQDGNGGTAFYTIPAAAVYGGAAIQFNPPLRQPTSNTALYCVNITTGASTKVSASGFKGA